MDSTRTFTLNTNDLQRIVIAVILRDTKYDDQDDREAYNRIEDLFTDLNMMTRPEHGYDLTVTVKA